MFSLLLLKLRSLCLEHGAFNRGGVSEDGFWVSKQKWLENYEVFRNFVLCGRHRSSIRLSFHDNLSHKASRRGRKFGLVLSTSKILQATWPRSHYRSWSETYLNSEPFTHLPSYQSSYGVNFLYPLIGTQIQKIRDL